MSAVIDTTRTITFEQPWPDEAPGWVIVEYDPVRNLVEGNGHFIWPGFYRTRELAEIAYLEHVVEAGAEPAATHAQERINQLESK